MPGLSSFSYCLHLLHIVIIIFSKNSENHKRKLETTNIILKSFSLISPVCMFLTYYFNACVAHNLYSTFFQANSSKLEKRMKKYQIFAIILSVPIIIISFIFNDPPKLDIIAINYYPDSFLKYVYIIGLIILCLVLYQIFFIMSKKDKIYSYLVFDTYDHRKKELTSLLIRRHIYFIITFFICYAPNNIIGLIQSYSDTTFCAEKCYMESFCIMLMSSSCTISFCLKMSEPYMQKYIKIVLSFILRKKASSNVLIKF
jgi:hypothetical protein